MSFVKNILFGGKVSKDPTGLVNECSDAKMNGSEEAKEPIVEGTFFPRTLYKYNGHDSDKIFIAIKGNVYDCTAGRQFYGPSGPYSNFAGHDASRGLALNSFDMEAITQWDEPMDDLSDLTPQQLEALDSWVSHFERKYPKVGQLIPEPGVNI